MSCIAWPNQTPFGTASNFLQCKWVSCSQSYWQGYDLGWYKDMGTPCFPQPNLWLARCASMSWRALKKFVVLSTQRLRVGIKPFIPLRAASSSRQEAAAGEQQVSSSKQQQEAASSSKQQQALAPLKEWSNISFKNQTSTKIELFPGARPQNNEIVQLIKVVVMPNLNFFQAHGLPIRLLRADMT